MTHAIRIVVFAGYLALSPLPVERNPRREKRGGAGWDVTVLPNSVVALLDAPFTPRIGYVRVDDRIYPLALD